MLLLAVVSGCGRGGYAGAGIKSLSSSAITIDATQSIAITANLPTALPLTWRLQKTQCAGSGDGTCGRLSTSTGSTITYLAPATVTTPFKVALTATISGTTAEQTATVTVNPAPSISGNPPAGTVGAEYQATLAATGGTAPLKLSIASGTMSPGLAFNAASGIISGTPTAAGMTDFVAQVVDSSDVPFTVTAPKQINVTAAVGGLAVVSGNPPDGVVSTAYSTMLQAAGGTSPYAWNITSGALPAGLTLSTSTGAISGTPTTQGTVSFVAQAKDAKGVTAQGSFSIKITGSSSGGSGGGTGTGGGSGTGTSPVLTISSPPSATAGSPYTGTIPVSGGTAPFTCSLVSGTLPSGLSLNPNCQITGTPVSGGTVTVGVQAMDSNSPPTTSTGTITVTVNPSALTLATGTLPNGSVGVSYTATLPVSGGKLPYACALINGTLPAGLSLAANCIVSGTPTVAGTQTVSVRATDAGAPAQTITAMETITIVAAPSLAITSPVNGTVGTIYTGTVGVTGGTSPYMCSLAGGALPAGLTLSANCQVTGTPTAPGTSTAQVTATDASLPAKTTTGPVYITVTGATPTLVIGNPPTATVSTPYTGTIPVSGGTWPYSCTISGSLPSGLSLGAACSITGTPVTAGTVTVTATATDSASHTTTGPVVVTVQPVPALSLTGSIPYAILNQPYTQTLAAMGGVGPYTYAVTSGAPPTGISLSTAGVLSGTPTVVGANSFTVTATDSEGTPQTASLPLVLQVVYAPTASDALLTGPYAYLFQGYDDAAAGVLAYRTSTVASFTANGTGVLSAGEMDENHQGSNPSGNTISSGSFLGTYTIGTDRRGFLTLTRLNADGTTGVTSTYAISVRAPIAPATNSASGSLIEFDSDMLAGTRGTGTLLAQNPAAVTAGITGSYAFGLSGDTPCLPACTVGLVAGPVATVGQFTAAGGNITSGTSDTNIANGNVPNSALSGTYSAADSNGRVQMSLVASNLTGGFFPTDYAVYIVDANNAFVMSTDKHSSFILVAGSAQRQTQATYTNASLGAPFVGYENSPVNPGVAGQTLQNVANLSTATVFRGTGNANGTCTTTNVDTGGLAGTVNALTGLGSNAPVLNAVLGTYQSLGNSNCGVAANGRVVLNYPAPSSALSLTLALLGLGATPPPARVVYLVTPNQGYFLETGYAGLGYLEAQTGAPFTTATLNGTFVYGTVPPSTVATINSNGAFTADGASHTTSTLDLNVGVGTVNVLQLGITGSANYALTDATAGRYLLGTSRVIYAISPNRFVLLETDPLTTSPYIALLY